MIRNSLSPSPSLGGSVQIDAYLKENCGIVEFLALSNSAGVYATTLWNAFAHRHSIHESKTSFNSVTSGAFTPVGPYPAPLVATPPVCNV